MADRDGVIRAVEPTGVFFSGRCEIQTPVCTAKDSAPITAVWERPGRTQVNVCRRCLEEMVRLGEWRIAGARISQHVDVAVLDQNRNPIVVVEVKKRPPVGIDREDEEGAWARRIRRNLVVHGAVPRARHFMVVIYPGHSYLWKEDEPILPDAGPVAVFDATSDISEHLSGAATAEAVEHAVASWLSTLIVDRARLPADLASSELAAELDDAVVVEQYAA